MIDLSPCIPPPSSRTESSQVVAGKVLAADVMTMSSATADGVARAISTKDGVKLNAISNVVNIDMECSNEVIHVIDPGLIPA